ncbi:hypothetical protein Hesp01_45670 [Herbidospora sp. NBRC 101105]|nr:hypothetical protein Hesp01_45670 [Herbidospora sp. NBRC 101105]
MHLAGLLTVRAGLAEELRSFLDATGLPFDGCIEVVTDAYTAPPLAVRLHANVETLYS